ncbi:MAG: tyrosine-type recombinase/integrase [Leptolyngbyaceae cyanobacterium SM2_5_2]|nr:tyrosine-type recombinase/integrase [Leptolyngbyaceae cyanobacterium SM2_5_2]
MPKNNRNGKAEIFSDGDLVKLRKALTNPKHRLLFDIARWTGERLGAIRQLAVDDVYDCHGNPRQFICFRAQTRKASRGHRITRECPVHPNLREILLAYKPPISGPLFPGPLGPMSFQGCDQVLRRALERASLDHKGYSSHSFRRTLITRLSEKGVDIKTIQVITGHRDLKVLLGYVEADPKRAQRAIALL